MIDSNNGNLLLIWMFLWNYVYKITKTVSN